MNRLLNTAFVSLLLLLPLPSLAETAPDFTLPSNQNTNIKLSEELGNVVLINFWATWCGPCRQEMPELEKLHTRYEAAGFQTLGVNVEEDSAAAVALAKKLGVSFPVLFDTASTVSELYQVRAMPTTVLVDRNGKVRHVYKGYKPGYEDKYRQDIKSLIREL